MTLPDAAAPAIVPLTVVGQARVDGRDVRRTAVPVEAVVSLDRPRQFAASESWLSVVPTGPFTLAWEPSEVRLAPGGRTEVKLLVRRAAGFTAPLRIALQRLPRDITSAPVTVAGGDTEAKLVLAATAKAAPRPIVVYAAGTLNAEPAAFVQHTPPLRIQLAPAAKTP